MGTLYIGSARHDENGNYVNGSAGDSLQTTTPDYSGEVSMQAFYVHTKGWNVLRAKSITVANALAERMKTACNNANIGYDQNGRYGIITYGIDTKTKTECDCSSLVRECVKEATGKDPGDFTTANEVSVLMSTGYFDNIGTYKSSTILCNGDILTTLSQGHTVIVVSGNARATGWQQDSTGYWWLNEDGTYPTMCWMGIAESSAPEKYHWYLFGGSGYMLKGWVTWNSKEQKTGSGDWYYLEESGGLEGACYHETEEHKGALEIWTLTKDEINSSSSSSSSSSSGPGY